MADDFIDILKSIIDQVTLYVPYLTITFGTLGGLFNLMTFTDQRMRKNPCAFYFLFASIFDLLTLLICTVMRLMLDHYSYLIPYRSLAFCKVRTYLTVALPMSSTGCVMLASIDRCLLLSRSLRWRRWSHIHTARRLLILSNLHWFLASSHIPFFYGFYTVNEVPYTCSSQPGVYSTFFSAFLVIWLTLMPHAVMLVCIVITGMHIRASRRHVLPLQLRQRQKYRRMDRHLMVMVLTQVLLSGIFFSTRTVVVAYQLLTRDHPKDRRARALESFVSQLGIVLVYVNYAKSFYIYSLSSPSFCEVFRERLSQCWISITHPLRRDR